jgi:hypothetical protein
MTYAMHSIRNKALVIALATLMAVGFMLAVLPVPGAQAATHYFYMDSGLTTPAPMGDQCISGYGFFTVDSTVYAKVYLQEAQITVGGYVYTGHIDSFIVNGIQRYDPITDTAAYPADPDDVVPVQIGVAITSPPGPHPFINCYIVVPPKS